MKYRPLSHTGVQVSEICLGTMQLQCHVSEKDSFRLLDAFLDGGGNFLDTADMYSQWVKGFRGGESETVIGKWMKQRGNRDKVVLATKVRSRMWDGPDGEGLSRKHVLRACEDSLRRLQTDRIDLYQSHWPDKDTPIDETLSAYETLVREGKVRFIGCSNYSGKELEGSFAGSAGVRYVCIQPHYSLILHKEFEKSVLPIVRRESMAVIPYSPLEGGFLTGKYRKGKPLPDSVRAGDIKKHGMTDKNFSVIDLLDKISKQNGRTILQTALGWLLSHDWITAPIIGANSIEQLKESLGAAGLRLSREDKETLDSATTDL